MGKVYGGLDARLREFVEAQRVFFVATAPLAGDGHVNLSPKGVDGTLAILDEHTVAYLDLTASGAETIAHLRENGRITLMFCSFDRTPKVLRLHGHGRVVTPYDDAWSEASAPFPHTPVARAVIVVDVSRVSDSCGYGVPLAGDIRERDLLIASMERKPSVIDYRVEKNRVSIDGLPAFDHDPVTP
ncbi:pyridoxamine 5'-phosphate oxidase family protein [Nocardioides terrisoli]|uniref:pyridoxamine 5'-phosphate oxidase family protein n=1 Tax=Nocardioides terrisoli TaxID=3388267 RepID=UPI00287BA46B|nr:pyridoxamine 5'-phosphate oxidase family protein [Nocardioides marmorisolisilvae]